MTKALLSGNEAVAEGVRLARAQVVAAYPITPQTTIVEKLAEMIGERSLSAEFIPVESEHSAMAASIGASLAGARAFTATSSQGLALMHEMLHWASGQRVPVVMANVNRALAPPWNVWVDHTDSMAQRDTGWIQIYAETNEEVLATILQAYRVAEDPEVLLPTMVMLDAFVLSHTYMPVEIPSQEAVDQFLPSYRPVVRVEPGTMQLFGSFSPPDLAYMEFRHDMASAMQTAHRKLIQAGRDYARAVGGQPLGPIDEYRTEDAEVLIVALGSLAAAARDTVDEFRREGRKVGLARIRVFRPFPEEEIRALGSRVQSLVVVERAHSFGSGGPVATEVRSALLDLPSRPAVASYIAGLGGREVTPMHLRTLVERAIRKDVPREAWVGVKEVIA